LSEISQSPAPTPSSALTPTADPLGAPSVRGAARPEVAVLLSTHNGAEHLDHQLESLAQQQGVDLWLAFRDDGSSDPSRTVVDRWRGRIRVADGEHAAPGAPTGIVESYAALLRDPAAAADYVAFCDQDDVWKADKLARAVRRLSLEDPGRPALYCSRLEIVDAHLRHRGYSPTMRHPPAFANAMVENIATGCTVVLNRAARDLVVSRPWPGAVLHDWWCYLVVSAFGRVIWDSEATLLYRQHGANAVGTGGGPAQRFLRKVARQLAGGSGDRLARQLAGFLQAHGDALPPGHRELVESWLAARETPGGRWWMARAPEPWRQSPVDDLAYRMLLALGRL